MCGIAGIYQLSNILSPDKINSYVNSMLSLIRHRGPDGSGVWISKNNSCALGHCRLSIVDPYRRSDQPFLKSNGHDTLALTFNGEIYNYLNLKSELVNMGYKFSTASDTEVLLSSFHCWSMQALDKIDGMFAFAIYDSRTGDLWLARDKFGEKPLYYSRHDSIIAFSSELKSLISLPWVSKEINEDALADYFMYQYIPAPNTIFRSCYKVLPGQVIKIRQDGSLHQFKYFSFITRDADRSMKIEEREEQLDYLIRNSIKERTASLSKPATFLSGGLDSTTVAAIAKNVIDEKPLYTFSVGFEGATNSEHILAAKTAAYLNTCHYQVLVSPNMIDQAKFVASIIDEPLADSGLLPMFLAAQLAAKHCRVVLSGDGSDEMFGGYKRYLDTLHDINSCCDNGKKRQLGDTYLTDRILYFTLEQTRKLLGNMPKDSQARFIDLREKLNHYNSSPLNAMREYDVANYMTGAPLAKVDRMSMFHALEVRSPYLQCDIAEFAASLGEPELIDKDLGKFILRKVAARYLPNEYIFRAKVGFGVPDTLWDLRQMISYLNSMILTRDSYISKVLDVECFKSYFANMDSNSGYISHYQIWAILVLEYWLENLFCSQERPVPIKTVWKIDNASNARAVLKVEEPNLTDLDGPP